MKPQTTIALKKMGKLIRLTREELNLSQIEVSEKSGIKQQYLSQLENGNINFTFDMLISVCIGMNVNPVIMLLDKEEYNKFMNEQPADDKGMITFN